jgi:hypothetical protein
VDDKLIESDITKEELVTLLRKAQAERDRLVTENLKLESERDLLQIRLHTIEEEQAERSRNAN